jgi:anthranilate synthase
MRSPVAARLATPILGAVGSGAAADDGWITPAGVTVTRISQPVGPAVAARAALEEVLNYRRGLLIFRDRNRAIGYHDPPVEIVARGGRLTVRALNERGRVLLPALRRTAAGLLDLQVADDTEFGGTAAPSADFFAEEDRSRHAGIFRTIRALVAGMAAPGDHMLGLCGAFGYDVAFQLDPIELHTQRDPGDRDMVLHLPDEITELDFRRDEAVRHQYEFALPGVTTVGLPRGTERTDFSGGTPGSLRDHQPGGYAETAARAIPLFQAGDLFEVVPSQVFRRACMQRPAELFRRVRACEPTAHNLLMNLGEGEYLVGASPEMFVRVRHDNGRQLVQTSPISGTIARGKDALEDAARIRELLNSRKDESELTMCTDVDRNDKSRVCSAGSVRVTARRQIEMYSALIHTVDHVEGVLRPDRDALDAFLAHLWAVTVTGAPKLAAMEFIERNERSPRRWYGGAVGRLGFDGTAETVLTLRTIQIRDGIATVRAGATLLCDSDPAAEETETELKAATLLRMLGPQVRPVSCQPSEKERCGDGLSILLVDHRDSFVHCLGDYLRRTGAQVATYRSGRHMEIVERQRPDLIVLSPGPGRPGDFGISATIGAAERLGIPVFGVCLGLQGLIEYFGGSLRVLDRPMHGKQSTVTVTDPRSRLLAGLPPRFGVGRYHSLHAAAGCVPGDLRVVATADDGVVMAVEHRTRPLAGVQFHPESIMTADGHAGEMIIRNAVSWLSRR